MALLITYEVMSEWGNWPAQTVSWMGVHSCRVTWSWRQTEQTEQANEALRIDEKVPDGHLRHTVFWCGEQARAAPHPWAHSSQALHSLSFTIVSVSVAGSVSGSVCASRRNRCVAFGAASTISTAATKSILPFIIIVYYLLFIVWDSIGSISRFKSIKTWKNAQLKMYPIKMNY